jgi:hypothetical protein
MYFFFNNNLIFEFFLLCNGEFKYNWILVMMCEELFPICILIILFSIGVHFFIKFKKFLIHMMI